jgi:hypothetical protein
VKVALLDRKREVSTVQTGAEFLYGERLSEKGDDKPPEWRFGEENLPEPALRPIVERRLSSGAAKHNQGDSRRWPSA